jgi:hypothetical protein
MTEEELRKKIEKEEKWLIHALNDQTEATSSYSVDIAFDAVKHYVKDYINSQQRTGSGRMTREEAIYELERMKTWSKDLSDDEIEAIVIALKALDKFDQPMKFKYCPMCGSKMEE